MTHTLQQGISKMSLGAVSAALTLAVVLVLGVITTQSAQAQTFTVLWPFAGGPSPASPDAGLTIDAAGNLYGATVYGGPNNENNYFGTVFEVSSKDKDTVLYNFCSVGGCPDGAWPHAGVTMDAKGNLYGTTTWGGTYPGYGTVYKLTRKSGAWTETVLYSFTGGTTDGCSPEGGLLLDKSNTVYGTTYGCGTYNYGTVFKVDTSGKETVLHSFAYADGANPYLTSLLMDSESDLYGVALNGGGGFGTVYKLSKNRTFTLLYSFTGGTTDGCYPSGTPLMDTKGNLYGTAEQCGSSGDGVVWKVSKNGNEKVLHNFAGGTADGANPYAGVIMDSAKKLYGTTYAGGASSLGTVYELNPKGALTVLHSFASSDGSNPYGGVIRDAKGDLYGTTYTGGTGGYGTVWKLKPKP